MRKLCRKCSTTKARLRVLPRSARPYSQNLTLLWLQSEKGEVRDECGQIKQKVCAKQNELGRLLRPSGTFHVEKRGSRSGVSGHPNVQSPQQYHEKEHEL